AVKSDTVGTAVFNSDFSQLEAFVPFISGAGAAFEANGEEVWVLLGTRSGSSESPIELMITRGGRVDEATYVALTPDNAEEGSAGAPDLSLAADPAFDQPLGKHIF